MFIIIAEFTYTTPQVVTREDLDTAKAWVDEMLKEFPSIKRMTIYEHMPSPYSSGLMKEGMSFSHD